MKLVLGVHWIFEGYGADRAHLASEPLLRDVLDALPERLGLTKVSAPQTYRQLADGAETVAGIVLIAESHLSLHAFPLHGVLHGDLFSCKAFSLEDARAYLTERYRVVTFEEQVHERSRA